MSIDLKACPFCGNKEPTLCPADYVHDDLSPWPVVECRTCNAWVPANVWNTRATESHCKLGELCNCGGDTERVRDGCSQWVRATE